MSVRSHPRRYYVRIDMSIPSHCKKLNRDSLFHCALYPIYTVVVNNFITWVLRLNESPERAFISVPDENIRASHGPPRGHITRTG